MLKQKKINPDRQFWITSQPGFTLMEVVVGLGIAMILIAGILGTTSILSKNIKLAREKTVLSTLAANYLEAVRNLPYSQVGTVNGNPAGTLPDQTNAVQVTLEGQQYQVYYEVTYIDDPADGTILAGTDTAPNDYKQVKMYVKKVSTGAITNFSTNVSPKGLENTTNAGALLIKVFSATGVPIAGANIHLVNSTVNPNIVLDRQSDNSGQWIEVGLPAGANAYNIVVTKAGFSTDQTQPITQSNPNPSKPDATVSNGQVTQISFFIDQTADLTVVVQNQSCQAVGSGIGVNIHGDAIADPSTNPPTYAYNQNFNTDASGKIILTGIPFDTYTPALLSGQNLIVYGSNPVQRITLQPGTTQIFTLLVGPNTTPNSLLVIVKDAATGVPLEGATVHLQKGGSTPQDFYGATGGSIWLQTDWKGGSGQANWSAQDRYFSDDGNLDITSGQSQVKLKKINGNYVSSGWLESSSFDTTTTSNYATINWQPTSQPANTVLKFQVASNNNNATWDYKGPDGTASTYYATPGTTLHSSNNGNRYIRYKVFFSSTNGQNTPVLTSMNLNYVTGCFTPGQTIFTALSQGNNYNLDVSLTGYTTAVLNSISVSGNQIQEILLTR